MAGVAAGGSMASEWVLGAPAAMVVNKQAVVAATVAANAGVQHCNRARARVVSQFAPPDVCDPLLVHVRLWSPMKITSASPAHHAPLAAEGNGCRRCASGSALTPPSTRHPSTLHVYIDPVLSH
jgi:hypothetical protein